MGSLPLPLLAEAREFLEDSLQIPPGFEPRGTCPFGAFAPFLYNIQFVHHLVHPLGDTWNGWRF